MTGERVDLGLVRVIPNPSNPYLEVAVSLGFRVIGLIILCK